MSLVATLVCAPSAQALTHDVADKACKVLGAREMTWLCDKVALDIAVPEGIDTAMADARLRELLVSAPIDVAVQADGPGRRKKLLLADMDSTMIDQECIDELAAVIGIKDKVAAITARAMNGEIAFEPALRERVALLAGLPATVAGDVIADRITLASGGRALVATMKRFGAYTALVSGGFTAFTRPIAAELGFDEQRANRLVEKDGKLSGEVAEPILGKMAKAQALAEIAARLGISPARAIAVGDGANDLDMLQLAGTGVALHAKPAVAAQASVRIDHGDLTALLYIQGYRKHEFAG